MPQTSQKVVEENTNMSEKQRQLLASKMMDLANLGYASLVIGQMVGDNFHLRGALLGMILFIFLYVASITLLQGGH